MYRVYCPRENITCSFKYSSVHGAYAANQRLPALPRHVSNHPAKRRRTAAHGQPDSSRSPDSHHFENAASSTSRTDQSHRIVRLGSNEKSRACHVRRRCSCSLHGTIVPGFLAEDSGLDLPMSTCQAAEALHDFALSRSWNILVQHEQCTMMIMSLCNHSDVHGTEKSRRPSIGTVPCFKC